MGGQVTGAQRFYDNFPINSYTLIFWFETDGTNNPSIFSGNVRSVTRLTSTGGEEFYRIRMQNTKEDSRAAAFGTVRVANSIDDLDDLEGVVPIDITTPTNPIAFQVPAATALLRATEFDVAVRDGATRAFTNQVLANRRVYVSMAIEKATRAV